MSRTTLALAAACAACLSASPLNAAERFGCNLYQIFNTLDVDMQQGYMLVNFGGRDTHLHAFTITDVNDSWIKAKSAKRMTTVGYYATDGWVPAPRGPELWLNRYTLHLAVKRPGEPDQTARCGPVKRAI
jgi:hypothetical protein